MSVVRHILEPRWVELRGVSLVSIRCTVPGGATSAWDYLPLRGARLE